MDEEPQDKELYARIDTMTSDELDQLPRGAIQLDTSGKILQYNLFEQRMANIRKVCDGAQLLYRSSSLHGCEGIPRPVYRGSEQEEPARDFSLPLSFQ
jgi:hypothetical protein